jgi:hypothetical protein
MLMRRSLTRPVGSLAARRLLAERESPPVPLRSELVRKLVAARLDDLDPPERVGPVRSLGGLIRPAKAAPHGRRVPAVRVGVWIGLGCAHGSVRLPGRGEPGC